MPSRRLPCFFFLTRKCIFVLCTCFFISCLVPLTSFCPVSVEIKPKKLDKFVPIYFFSSYSLSGKLLDERLVGNKKTDVFFFILSFFGPPVT